MTFYDFDSTSALEKIKMQHSSIKKLKEKLADDRAKFRDFCCDIDLDNSILFDSIDTYERTLLIDCYTYSEQLTKSLIYHLLDKDNNSNTYIETFIDRKINPERFSPNVKFDNLGNVVNDVYDKFQFILKNISETEVYDELIKSRHRYAHKGRYTFDFLNFLTVIDVLEYITFEFELIQNAEFDRVLFIGHLNEYLKWAKKINDNPNRADISEEKNKLNLFFYNNLYSIILLNNKLLKKKIDELERGLFSMRVGLSDDEKAVFYMLKGNNGLTIEDVCRKSEGSKEINIEIINNLATKGMIEKVFNADGDIYRIRN